MSDTEPDAVPVKKEKRKVNDKQMAALRKGMDALKVKRETLAKEREVHEEKKAKGEIPADTPLPVQPKKVKPVKVVTAPTPPPEVVIVQRKPPTIKPNPMIAEMAALRAEVSALKAPAVVVEKIVDRPVDRVVEKTKVLSGSDLLNQIFFNK